MKIWLGLLTFALLISGVVFFAIDLLCTEYMPASQGSLYIDNNSLRGWPMGIMLAWGAPVLYYLEAHCGMPSDFFATLTLGLFLFLLFGMTMAIIFTRHLLKQPWKPWRWAWISAMFASAAVLVPLPVVAYYVVNILPNPEG